MADNCSSTKLVFQESRVKTEQVKSLQTGVLLLPQLEYNVGVPTYSHQSSALSL